MAQNLVELPVEQCLQRVSPKRHGLSFGQEKANCAFHALVTYWALVLLLCQIPQRTEWRLPLHILGRCGDLGEAFPHLGTLRRRHLSPDQLAAAYET